MPNTVLTLTRYTRFQPSPSLPFSTNVVTAFRQNEESKVGYQNPWHRSQIEQVVQAGTTRSLSETRYTLLRPLSYKVRWTSSGNPNATAYIIDSTGIGAYTLPAPVAPTHRPLATQRFLAAAYSELQKFEGATAVGELADTLRLLRSPLQGIRRALNGIAFPKSRDHRQWKRDAADQWLETQYGILPLLNDAASLANAFLARANVNLTRRVFGADESMSLTGQSWEVIPGIGGQKVSQRYSSNGIRRHRTRVSGAIMLPHNDALTQFGFDSDSFVLAGWEVIPWSVLVDYIVPLGQFIQATCFRRALIRWSSITTVSSVEEAIIGSTHRRSNTSGTLHELQDGNTFLAHGRRAELQRSHGFGELVLPSISFRESVTPLLNSIALLVSQRNAQAEQIATHRRFPNRQFRRR